MPASVSVIICTYNRAAMLRRTLRALAQQTMPPEEFEVIVVDDGSHDDTASVCDAMRSVLPNLRCFSHASNRGLSRSRNTGIAEASGDYLIFTDDDCIPVRDWVERTSAALKQQPIVAGAVSTPVSDYLRLCHNIAEFHAVMPGRQAGASQFIAGANMGMRRSVLEELDGFTPDDRCAEDMHFVLRARLNGHTPYYEPGAVVVHDPDRITFTSIVGYAARHAATTILLRNRYRSLLRTPLVLRSPSLLLFCSPLIAAWVTAKIFMRNTTLLNFLHAAPVVFILKVAWCWGAAQSLLNKAAPRGGTCQGI